MQNDRELDQIIDAALPNYSEAEPRPGMERRILARSMAEEPRNRRFLWVWTAAVPTIACILVLLFLFGKHRPAASIGQVRIQPQTPASAPTHQQSPTMAASHLRRKKAQPHMSNVAAGPKEQTLPRKDIFPTPSPLTAEERALVALNRVPVQRPGKVEVAAAEIEPIHIAELHIKPFAVKTLNVPDSLQSNLKNNQP